MGKRLKIGVTGGIGSGKSLVCRIFGLLGVPIFDADREAKRLMTTDVALRTAICTEFGTQAYRRDGTLNREYLAKHVFRNENKLQQLNELVHPVVIQAGKNWAKLQHTSYNIKEAALLFETGSHKLNDYNILVTAPETLRIQRVMERDGTTVEQVTARIRKQWSDQKKQTLTDFVLVNDGVQAMIPQVLELDRVFRLKVS